VAYQPTEYVARSPSVRLIEEVDFDCGGAYALYNRELFFHIAMHIATRLSQNQRFEEAQRWFHCILDPTDSSGDEPPACFWKLS
jgi:hypothetical protein